MNNVAPKEALSVTVRFAGDSGDGMQLLGNEWVKSCAESRNDLATMPDFPAEIRAPAGTLAGVSGFQIQFSSSAIFTAGDQAQVLVALNPAALKANVRDLKKGGTIIVNSASFNEMALAKAGFTQNPLIDQSLAEYHVIAIDMNNLLRKALDGIDISARDVQKCKNFFCLGLLYWLYARDPEKEVRFIEEKFKKDSSIKEANLVAFRAGYAYGENTESMPARQHVGEAPLKKGCYRVLTGNKALALGLLTASAKAKLPLFYASYPITPASDILHELANLRAYGANTLQVEDEMAAICAAIGASYGGALGATATSGPGFALKAEALGYATMLEIPLIVVDVQRAGPSTGMPTKTEQSDLLQALYGRSGEAPVPVLAASGPGHCFDMAFLATQIAITFMTPVIILSDAAIATCAAPWAVVDPDELPNIVAKNAPLNLPYAPYERDENLSRAWILPGTEGTIHQLGGLEKDMKTGKISYDPANHELMTKTRALKIEGVKNFVKAPTIFGEANGELLLLGFGGTFGPLRQACIDLQREGFKVSHLHVELLNPIHDQVGYTMAQFKRVVIAEHNLGQLHQVLRAKFLVNASKFNKVMGKPFLVEEIVTHVKEIFNENNEAM